MNFENVEKNLKKRSFSVKTFSPRDQATDYLNNTIDNTTVSFGGAMTVKEMKLFDTLSQHNTAWWHGKGKQLKEYGGEEIMKNAMNTEVYITSANAVSEQGQIINIDGRCNRIASTLFGHKKVFFVIGKNKLAPTFEIAMWRARNIAAPKNAQRLGKNTPCAVKGDKCYDCNSAARICRGFLILEYPPSGTEVEIILIDEELGY